MISLGDNQINNIYFGDKTIKSVYLGDKLIWSNKIKYTIEFRISYSNYTSDQYEVGTFQILHGNDIIYSNEYFTVKSDTPYENWTEMFEFTEQYDSLYFNIYDSNGHPITGGSIKFDQDNYAFIDLVL